MPVLNDSVVRAAKPGIIWDEKLKGFGLRTGKQTKTFIVLVASGRRKRLGRYPLLSLAKAREAAQKILANKTLGAIVPKHVAYEDARDTYLDDCKARLRLGTVTLYKWYLTNVYDFGRKNLGDVTGQDVLGKLKGFPRTKRSHAFRIGRKLFKWAYQTHLIEKSPFDRMAAPPKGGSRSRVLSPQELGKVYRHVKTLDTPLKRLVWLLIHTGQRVGEIRKLDWKYVSETSLTTPAAHSKNAHEHAYPISPETAEALYNFPRISEAVFPGLRTHKGKTVTYMTVGSKQWRELQEACGVHGFTRHDLRRTLATFWAEQLAVDPHLIERMLNHVSGQVSGVAATYNRARYLDQLRPHVLAWEAYLSKL